MDEETFREDTAYFSGKCTCQHSEEKHTWGSCGVLNCECEAGWEE